MLLVKTYLGPSKIEGIGVFAGQRIYKGTLIWVYQPGFDLMLHEEFVKQLPLCAQEQIKHFSFREGNLYWLDSDNARFFNSSPTPNTVTVAKGYDGTKQYIPNIIAECVAARKINEGEEITCNYAEFDQDVKEKLGG